MKRELVTAAGLSLALALGACGTDGTTTGSTSAGVSVTGGGGTPADLASLIAEGKEIDAKAANLSLSKKHGDSESSVPVNVTPTVADANGDVTSVKVTVGGASYTLQKAAFDSSQATIPTADGGSAEFDVYTGKNGTTDTFNQLGGGDGSTKYHTILGYNIKPKSSPNEQGFFSVGVPTQKMPTGLGAPATYKGSSRIYVVPTTGFTGPGDHRQFKGDLTLQANFAANTIGGSVDNIGTRLGTDAPHTFTPVSGGAMAISNGAISGNGITATMTPNKAVTDAEGGAFTGNVSGTFYGPNADEIGGTVAISGNGRTGIGYITAKNKTR